jgi:hypothetical protein
MPNTLSTRTHGHRRAGERGPTAAGAIPWRGPVTTTVYTPHPGDIVEDTLTRRVGRVMGFEGSYVQLRPVGGGLEWDARLENLQPVTGADALSSAISVVNARSRGEQL